jgi:hypothetical protein
VSKPPVTAELVLHQDIRDVLLPPRERRFARLSTRRWCRPICGRLGRAIHYLPGWIMKLKSRESGFKSNNYGARYYPGALAPVFARRKPAPPPSP